MIMFRAWLVIVFAALGSIGSVAQFAVDPNAIYAINLAAVRDQSDIGLVISTRFDDAVVDLERLDAAIKSDLERREAELTKARASLDVAEFQQLAAEYDNDVQMLREQFSKLSQAVADDYDARRLYFLTELMPTLAEGFRRQLGISILVNRDNILAIEPTQDLTGVFISFLDQFYAANKETVDDQLFSISTASSIVTQSLPIFEDLPITLDGLDPQDAPEEQTTIEEDTE